MSASPFTSEAQFLARPKNRIEQLNISDFIQIAVFFDLVISMTAAYALFFLLGFAAMDADQGIISLLWPASVSLTYVVFKLARRGYRPREYLGLRRYVANLLLCWSGALISVAVVSHAAGFGADISHDWLVASFAAGLVLLPLGRMGVARSIAAAERQGSRNAYVVCADREAATSDIMRDFERDPAIGGVRIVGASCLGDRADETGAENWDALVDEIRNVLKQEAIDEIQLRVPTERADLLSDATAALKNLPIRVLHIDEPFATQAPHAAQAIDSGSTEPGDRGVLELLSPPISARGLLVKRMLDLAVASAALLVLLPILAMACIGIALESGRPIIFRQNRKGVGGRPFTIFKLRTMSVQENGEKIVQACRNDPRVTKLGAILRRTSIDELPQLLNVLRGDMSIVGPRPHALAHDTYYGGLIKEYARRHNVKPGLTGWAQVNGFRGETRDLHAMSERVRHDIWYIENWSIWLDIKIIARTAGCVLFQKQAY